MRPRGHRGRVGVPHGGWRRRGKVGRLGLPWHPRIAGRREESMSPVCYLLISADGRRTYIGATTDLQRRLRQHNGLLSGGARATTTGRPWQLRASVGGFRSWRETLSFEWHWKHLPGRRASTRGCRARVARLWALVRESAWEALRPVEVPVCGTDASSTGWPPGAVPHSSFPAPELSRPLSELPPLSPA